MNLSLNIVLHEARQIQAEVRTDLDQDHHISSEGQNLEEADKFLLQ